jgi:O-antigen ligase
VAICVTFVWSYVQLGSSRDWRINTLIQNPLSISEIKALSNLDENSVLYLGLRFAFLERLTYWFDGWHIFNDYPIIGVGLGNAGFYFVDHMPAAGWGSYEIRDVVYRNGALANIKSFWVRLLAETGIVGFMLFLSWYYLLWRSSRTTQHSRDPVLKMVALAGQLALIAFLVEGFSIDSFALPYLWVITGLISAAGAIYRSQAAAIKVQN